ncbi:E2F transcription factor-like E2FE [Rosa rugosa]|uniref:E2F transcription factor-like E2FE n=1 Tax=Rosa rugosa TaxID=74645 RepID=UPI002B4097AC|nr:E2F transcription factor-like E2FE [Rosa rugosa]
MSSSSAAAVVDRPPATTTTTRRDASYSRKQKSLSLLCSNFLSLYNRDDGATALIGLDDAASRLGVVRRRIYDIVNVLESVGLLSRKSKNTYTWKGFGAVPNALKELREEGLDLTPIPAACNNNNTLDETKREKSLALLAQNFVKLFVCTGSESKSISLDEAAKLLLGVGDAHNVSVMRTKVRRIYDIANVLSSVNLIEKTHTADTGKPAYRWLGLNGRRDGLNLNSEPNSEQAKKRSFGTDLTNASSKRSKVVEKRVQDQGEVENCNSDGCGAKESSKSYQFGPFAPVAVPRARKGVDINKVCWESLGAYYRPQYQNQAMKELFSHYREAWMLWNSQVADKNPIQSS